MASSTCRRRARLLVAGAAQASASSTATEASSVRKSLSEISTPAAAGQLPEHGDRGRKPRRRPGSEQCARLRGMRGAATLLESNVSVYGETVRLCFRAKGGKRVEKEVQHAVFAAMLKEAISRRKRLTSCALAWQRAIGGDVAKAPAMPQPADGQLFGRDVGEAGPPQELHRRRRTALPVLRAAPRRRQVRRMFCGVRVLLHRHDAADRCSSTAIGPVGFCSQWGRGAGS